MERPQHEGAVVLPFRKANIEQIDGEQRNLSRMSDPELQLLEHQLVQKIDNLKTELYMVQWELTQRPGGAS